MRNAIVNLGIENVYTTAIQELGYQLEDLYEEDLGNFRTNQKKNNKNK